MTTASTSSTAASRPRSPAATRAPGRARAPSASRTIAAPPPAPVPQAEGHGCPSRPASAPAPPLAAWMSGSAPGPGAPRLAPEARAEAREQAWRSSSWITSGARSVRAVRACPAPLIPPSGRVSARARTMPRPASRPRARSAPPRASSSPAPPSCAAVRASPTTSTSPSPVLSSAWRRASPRPRVLPRSASMPASWRSAGTGAVLAASRIHVAPGAAPARGPAALAGASRRRPARRSWPRGPGAWRTIRLSTTLGGIASARPGPPSGIGRSARESSGRARTQPRASASAASRAPRPSAAMGAPPGSGLIAPGAMRTLIPRWTRPGARGARPRRRRCAPGPPGASTRPRCGRGCPGPRCR